MRQLLLGLVSAAVLFAGPGCEGLVDPSDNITTEFRGTLAPGEGKEFQIRMTRSGEYSLRLRTLDPAGNNFVLISFGILDQGLCALVAQNFASNNQLALAGEIRDLNYCIQISDPGVLTETVSFVMELQHPPN